MKNVDWSRTVEEYIGYRVHTDGYVKRETDLPHRKKKDAQDSQMPGKVEDRSYIQL